MPRGTPCLPNLLVIGAAKAGTTSLHSYLSEHPEIFMSKRKELSFFDDLRWSRGLDWYKSNFDSSYGINGEASPRYTLYPKLKGVPERIKEVLGTPKLIYIVRDPIDRLLSFRTQLLELWADKVVPLDVTSELFAQSEYVLYSRYHLQLSRYLEFFPRELIHVVVMERLNANPRAVLRDIFRFIGVDENFWSVKFERKLNVADHKRFATEWYRRVVPDKLKTEIANPKSLPWPIAKSLDRLSRVGGTKIMKPIITKDEDARLQSLFADEVAALKVLLSDALPEWRSYR